MHESRARALRRLHLIIDAALLVGTIAAAWAIHAALQPYVGALREMPPFSEYAALLYVALPLWLALVSMLGLHRTFEHVYGRAELVARLVQLHLGALVGISVVAFLTQAIINRSLVGLFLVCSFVTTLVSRLALNGWVRVQHRRGIGQSRILLVGRPSARMLSFARDLAAATLAPRIIGYVASARDRRPGGSMPPDAELDVPLLGTADDLAEVLHEQPVTHVLFFPPYHEAREQEALLAACEDVGVIASFAVDLHQGGQAAPRVLSIEGHPFVTFEVAPKRPEWLAIKHGFDLLASAALVLVLSPVLAAVALAVLASMGRPILYIAERSGLYGRPFRMLKFRTMIDGAEAQKGALASRNEMDGPVFKVRDDPRVTRLGQVLRRTSLDELPQLFNVLSGAMSLVGPRPLPLAEQAQIRGWQRRRLSMKPGITCLWQVSGRNELSFDDWMLLDLKYIDEWSLLLDVLILLRTIPAVLKRRGAH